MKLFEFKTTHPQRDAVQPLGRKIALYSGLAGYVVLIMFGSLYPLADWSIPSPRALSFLIAPWPQFVTRTDVITNILAYTPFGFLLLLILRAAMPMRLALFWVTLAGFSLSFVMEFLQMFLPDRISSNVDILTNATGALAGGLFARMVENHSWPGSALIAWRKRVFLPGGWVNTGLALLCIWALSQLSLQFPSLVAGNLRTGFTPFWEVSDLSGFNGRHAILYFLEISGLGLFTATLIKPGHRMVPVLFATFTGAILLKFLAAALLIKYAVLLRLISLEALTGLGLGLSLMLALLHRRSFRRPYAAAVGVMLCFIVIKLFDVNAYLRTDVITYGIFHFPQRILNVTSLAYFISEIWPFLAVAFLVSHWWLSKLRVQEKSAQPVQRSQ